LLRWQDCLLGNDPVKRCIKKSMHIPPHAGDFIRQTYIEPFDISVRMLARNPGVSASALNRVINTQSGVSPSMALRLSKALGRSPESWIAMQKKP
jgi:addiction module HigA family antidote